MNDLKPDTFSLEQKSVEEQIAAMPPASFCRECLVTLNKIWKSLELLAFLGMIFMLLWAGTKIGSLASFKDALETLFVGLAAMLFARIGWALPNSKAKEVADRLTRIK